MSAVDPEGAVSEFKSLLMDLRRRNQRIISTMKGSVAFLHQADGFSCRGNLIRVSRLAVNVGVPRDIRYPFVDFSLSGTQVSRKVLPSSTLALQSYISVPGFSSGELLTNDCQKELKVKLPVGKTSMENASFAPWRTVHVQTV